MEMLCFLSFPFLTHFFLYFFMKMSLKQLECFLKKKKSGIEGTKETKQWQKGQITEDELYDLYVSNKLAIWK